MCMEVESSQEKQNQKQSEGRVIRGIKNLSEQGEEHYYKLVRVGKFYSNNHFEDESNGDRNKTINQ